jgi:hypothetical protein
MQTRCTVRSSDTPRSAIRLGSGLPTGEPPVRTNQAATPAGCRSDSTMYRDPYLPHGPTRQPSTLSNLAAPPFVSPGLRLAAFS